jgi:hypothetical protein
MGMRVPRVEMIDRHPIELGLQVALAAVAKKNQRRV